MMMFMPLMIIVIGVNFGAGLALYWVAQNIFGIVQQYFVAGGGALGPDVRAVAARSRHFLTGGAGAETDTSMAGSDGKVIDSPLRENGGDMRAGRDGAATPTGARGGSDLGWRAGLRRFLGTAEPEVTPDRNEPRARAQAKRRSARRRGGRRARGKR